jgi:hypothetical protein
MLKLLKEKIGKFLQEIGTDNFFESDNYPGNKSKN